RPRLGRRGAGKDLAHAARIVLVRGETTDLGAEGNGAGNVRVPVVPGDLFDHVDLELAVGAPRRDRHAPAAAGGRALEADRLEVAPNVVPGERRAENLIDAAGTPHGAGR